MIPLALAALALQGAAQTPPAQTPPALQVPPPSVTPPPVPAPDKVIATVGGTPLTAADVAPYLWAWKAREVANTLAVYRGIAGEAARAGVNVTDAELKAKYDEQIAQTTAKLQPGQTLDDAYGQVGGLPGLSLALRSSILLDKVAEKEFDPSGYTKLSMILFSSANDKPPTVTAAKSADTAYNQLKSGTPWNTVEKQFEKEPRLAQTNGSLGWAPIASFPADAKAQFATLPVNGYTKPIATPNGLAIFRVEARGKDASAADLAPLKASSLATARQAVLARIRAANKVEFKG